MSTKKRQLIAELPSNALTIPSDDTESSEPPIDKRPHFYTLIEAARSGDVGGVKEILEASISAATNKKEKPKIEEEGEGEGEGGEEEEEELVYNRRKFDDDYYLRRKLRLARAAKNINAKREGMTALHYAVFYCQPQVVPLLLSHPKIKLNEKNHSGMTALHWAVFQNFEEISLQLLNAGADANIPDNGGFTPLHRAAANGNIRLVEALITTFSVPADPTTNDELLTPLILAATAGHAHVVEFLASNNADVNAKTRGGSSAIHKAACKGHVETIRTLLENAADINITDSCGRTALHWAVYYACFPIITLLLENSADPLIADSFGNLPIHIMRSPGSRVGDKKTRIQIQKIFKQFRDPNRIEFPERIVAPTDQNNAGGQNNAGSQNNAGDQSKS